MNRTTFLILLLAGIISLVLVNSVNAQGTVGLTVSPLTFELTANPGDVIINQLKVYNPTDSVVGIKMEVEDFTVTGEMGFVTIEPAETETYSIARWVKTDPGEFALEPREQKYVTFTISIPENAEPGGHYGAIIAGTTGVVGEEFVGAAVAGRVGVLVLLTVSGEVTEDLIVKGFSCPNYSEYGPVNFTIRFENKGTIHVRPRGFVTITNWLGKKVADVEFPQNNVIPGAIRKIETEWPQKWLWAGKYTATLNGSYGTANIPLTPTVITLWAFPWKAGVGILLIVIFLILSRRRWLAAFRILIKGEKTGN